MFSTKEIQFNFIPKVKYQIIKSDNSIILEFVEEIEDADLNEVLSETMYDTHGVAYNSISEWTKKKYKFEVITDSSIKDITNNIEYIDDKTYITLYQVYWLKRIKIFDIGCNID